MLLHKILQKSIVLKKNFKAYLLLSQLKFEAIKVGKSCSLLSCGKFLGPASLLPLFEDLSLLKGLFDWASFGRSTYFDLEVSKGKVLEVQGLAADIGAGSVDQGLLKKGTAVQHKDPG